MAANFEDYESELVKVLNCTFTGATGNFANGTVYPITDGTATYNFRTTFYDVDYINTAIPAAAVHIVGIPNSRTDGDYFSARYLSDFTQDPVVYDPPTDLSYLVLENVNVELTWLPGPIPVDPQRDWENLTALKVYRDDVLIATITDFVEYEPATYVDADLESGIYTYYVTNVYFNEFESEPSNSVEVEITVSANDEVIPATVTALTGNYPNPFNPETTITYSVKNAARVNITIYNLKGAKVRTLVSETKGNGFYKAVWDGRDDSGKAVSSGVYLYRMQADNYVSTRRMMLMK